MLGWSQRCLVPFSLIYVPRIFRAIDPVHTGWVRAIFFATCLLLSFCLALFARFLELPYWNNPAYMVNGEFLLATHDAYHWIAGAEGFEFGKGHPMSNLVAFLASIFQVSVANAGFWAAPFLGSLVAVAVFLWAWGLGFPYAGLCAGVLVSLSPAFLARTLLGFYDTDLVVLSFAIFLGLVPALWISPWLVSPLEAMGHCLQHMRRYFRQKSVFPKVALCRKESSSEAELNPDPVFICLMQNTLCVAGQSTVRSGLAPQELHQIRDAIFRPMPLFLLILSGGVVCQFQGWHSLFPYLVRFSAFLLPVLILVFGPKNIRRFLMQAALCHVFSLLYGVLGIVLAALWALILMHSAERKKTDVLKASLTHWLARICSFLQRDSWIVWGLWVLIFCKILDAKVFSLMVDSFFSYVDRGGDLTKHGTVAHDPLVFPSVAQSIIEVQEVGINELLSYIYPNSIFIFIAFIFYFFFLFLLPVFAWFLPLLILAILSLRMGGRMAMFGAPSLLLPLAMGGFLCFEIVALRVRRIVKKMRSPVFCSYLQSLRTSFAKTGMGIFFTVGITLYLAWPLLMLIPDLTQGPALSQQQAKALQFIKEHSSFQDKNVVWNWWDWGYAVHHFSRRATIADGARHGGAALYLPAAVYTSADPRFARQLIKYTALKNNRPGEVFAGLSASEAQNLINSLKNAQTPLFEAPGKQYLLVSFEHLRLGIWITKYGSWDFKQKSGTGFLMNNLSVALDFNIETGQVVPKGNPGVKAKSISVFSPDALVQQVYGKTGHHFIFNLDNLDYDAQTDLDILSKFWKKQLGYFAYTAPAHDKMVVDEDFYNTLMVQLLLCDGQDPRFTPYFKLLYDNVYARVYEVL